MGENKKKKPVMRTILFATVAGLLVLATGAGRKEAAPAEQAPPRVITARFTDPVEMEAQNSQKCIACHTKTNPITKLASPPAEAHAEVGG